MKGKNCSDYAENIKCHQKKKLVAWATRQLGFVEPWW